MDTQKYFNTSIMNNTINKNISIFNSGLYIRLSREDNDKAESNSVVNQRNLLTEFTKNQLNLKLGEIYIDDGYTGTNFDRLGFIKMLNDIRSGKINCIIVKDLSRFGRNYLDVGNYLEQLLPFLKCRFISLLDNLDSYERPNEISSVFVQFKNIMNDHYSGEISQKLRYLFDAQRKEGKLVSPYAPYGYRKDPKDKHHLIVDDEAANIVKNMFQWFMSGMSIVRITQKLNSLKIVTPSAYRQNRNSNNIHNLSNVSVWHPFTIKRILTNNVYIGILDQKKTGSYNHKNRKRYKLDKKDRIIVYNTHDPIIELKIFDETQRMFAMNTRTAPREQKLQLFSGFLRCANCKKSMLRNPKISKGKLYVYYRCRTYSQISREICPTPHSISHTLLYKSVLHTIKAQIHSVANMQKVISRINETNIVKLKKINFGREIASRKRMITNKTNLKRGLYEDWKTDALTRNDYINMKKAYDDEIQQLEESIDKLHIEEQAIKDIETENIEWINRFIKQLEVKELSRELLKALVDKIYIDQNKNINIIFRYQDEYSRIIDYVKDHIDEVNGE